MAFFGVNFILQKFCPCNKNDKLEVCAFVESSFISGLYWFIPSDSDFGSKYPVMIFEMSALQTNQLGLKEIFRYVGSPIFLQKVNPSCMKLMVQLVQFINVFILSNLFTICSIWTSNCQQKAIFSHIHSHLNYVT